MKRLIFLLTSSIAVWPSCQDNKSNFDYDPAVPYPLLNAGDFWIDKFDQRGLQNAIIYRDKIYCNTIDVGGDENFLYCLNPKNGLVVWRGNVSAYASQSASFSKDIVVYSSYLGEISSFDSTGTNIWNAKFGHPYGGHWLDTVNSKLLVKTVYWKNVSEYDVNSGKLISDNENDSLQRLIEQKMKDSRLLETHEYQFVKMGKTYIIKCRPSKPDEIGEYTIEIIK
jgi:hypothetical protein